MKWTAEELEILEHNTDLNSTEMTSLLPNRTYEAIVQKRGKLGLQWDKQQTWREWELELLEEHDYLSNSEIAETVLPHRSYEAIKTARHKAGLAHMVRCNKCGEKFKKNNQHNICSKCRKTHKDYNSTFNHKYSSYRCGAAKRGYEFSLSKNDFAMFYNTDCTYCGDHIDGVGIDRVDNTKGYTLENSVACCEKCNRLKMALGLSDWLTHMRKIVINMGEL